jgi:hypothetical protein
MPRIQSDFIDSRRKPTRLVTSYFAKTHWKTQLFLADKEFHPMPRVTHRTRGSEMDNPTWRSGRDKRVPPRWRGMPVMPDDAGWMIQTGPADLTSRSLRKTKLEGHARRARSESHVYRARRSEMDNPTWRSGRDKRVPPRWRGMPVMPDDAGWMIQARVADATSASLRKPDLRSMALRAGETKPNCMVT